MLVQKDKPGGIILDKKKIIIICVAVGAVALVVAACIIFGGIFAIRPQPYKEPLTQPLITYEAQQPDIYTEPPTIAPTLPPATAPPQLASQGPFDFPMPVASPTGYFFVIDYYYPGAPGTGYRIISYEYPADLDFTAIVGKWYLESNKAHQITSNADYRALQASQGAQCQIDDRIGLSPQSSTNMAIVSVNPTVASATITLPNGNIITGTRSVVNGTTLFTFYTDGSTETIRLQVPDNTVLVCTDDATIEQMDARGKSYIQSRQASPADFFTKAYGGAVINLTNYPGGKLDIWCAAN